MDAVRKPRPSAYERTLSLGVINLAKAFAVLFSPGFEARETDDSDPGTARETLADSVWQSLDEFERNHYLLDADDFLKSHTFEPHWASSDAWDAAASVVYAAHASASQRLALDWEDVDEPTRCVWRTVAQAAIWAAPLLSKPRAAKPPPPEGPTR